LPKMPQRIGIVTSPTGAALQDMLNTLSRRYPLAEVILAPCAVQGDEAPPQILAALAGLNQLTPPPDVILIARGGGSLEDLWAFNDEGVVRAIASSPALVVTGIGHETDFTLSDFAADLRAPTPTAAAEIATPDILDLRIGVTNLSAHLRMAWQGVYGGRNMDLNLLQARLLRVLQERVYEPLGGVEPLKADVRIITATNKNLSKLVEQGRFREDLFYRIHIIRIELPSLRDRREDIPLLIDHFIARFNRLKGKDIAGVSDAVLARLMEHDFPGNVRELENIIEHAFVLCRGGVIELKHLPPPLRGGELGEALRLGKAMTLESMEKLLIKDALRRNEGNHQKAAKELGINPSTLFRKLKALKLARGG